MFSTMDLLGCFGFLAVMVGGGASYAMLLRSFPRRLRGECLGCGYSLGGGQSGGVCPECGLPVGSVHPIKSAWWVTVPSAIWSAASLLLILGIYASVDPEKPVGVWALTLLFFLPAILVPCFVSFWIAARGSWFVGQAAGFGLSAVLAFLTAQAVFYPHTMFAAMSSCLAPVFLPMAMGWGCWLPYVLHALLFRHA